MQTTRPVSVHLGRSRSVSVRLGRSRSVSVGLGRFRSVSVGRRSVSVGRRSVVAVLEVFSSTGGERLWVWEWERSQTFGFFPEYLV